MEALQTHAAHRKMWLVKLPNYLMDAYRNNTEVTNIGNVQVKHTPGRDSEISMHLSPLHPLSKDLPLNYALTLTQPQNVTHVFQTNKEGQPQSIDGIITHDAVASPQNIEDPKYRSLIRKKKTQTADTRGIQRKIQRIELNEANHTTVLPSNRLKPAAIPLANTKKVGRQSDERLPRAELVELLFTLFAQYAMWSFKGLYEKTRQPQVWLKEVLSEIAKFHKGGAYKGCYELKPEYRTNEAAAQVEPSALTGASDATKAGDAEDDMDIDEFEDA